MMKRFMSHVMFAGWLAAGLGVAHAEGLYVGGSLGSPDYKTGVNGIGGSGSGVSGEVFGGYQILPNLAVEGGVFDLGHADDGTGRVRLDGVYADAVGSYELAPRWSVLGRAGLAEGRFRTSRGDDSSPALKLGAGIQYELTPQVALRAQYDHYRFLDAFDAKPRVAQFSLGVKFGF